MLENIVINNVVASKNAVTNYDAARENAVINYAIPVASHI